VSNPTLPRYGTDPSQARCCGKQIARGWGAMAYEVIRITCQSDSARTRLLLEGKLAGVCVDELDKCWHAAPEKWATLLVDLTGVSFIDDRGKQLLKAMHDNGATFVSTNLMTRCFLEELSTDCTDYQ
jgi:hypothetical protein